MVIFSRMNSPLKVWYIPRGLVVLDFILIVNRIGVFSTLCYHQVQTEFMLVLVKLILSLLLCLVSPPPPTVVPIACPFRNSPSTD